MTLVAEEGEVCGGCAYQIDPALADEVNAALDAREAAGFERLHREVRSEPEGAPFAEALVYVAAATNPHFLGPLDERAIAAWVRRSRGPSGPNADYVLHLHDALAELGIEDPHVEEISRWLREEPMPAAV